MPRPLKGASSVELAIIVRSFNEDPAVVLKSLAELDQEVSSFGKRSGIVFVDDGSRPSLAFKASLCAGFRSDVRVLRHCVNLGPGAALETGLEFVRRYCPQAAWVGTFDPDGQHDPGDLRRMLNAAAEAVPNPMTDKFALLGSRFLGRAIEIPRRRLWVLRLGRLIVNLFYGYQLTDAHNGLRVFSRAAVSRVRLSLPDFSYASELIAQMRKHRVRVSEFPVTIRYTTYSTSKGQKDENAFRIVKEMVLRKLIP